MKMVQWHLYPTHSAILRAIRLVSPNAKAANGMDSATFEIVTLSSLERKYETKYGWIVPQTKMAARQEWMRRPPKRQSRARCFLSRHFNCQRFETILFLKLYLFLWIWLELGIYFIIALID